ncbi:ThiF family adenylyltransferase [Oscillospiraceae bacterium OttesenSCG-928-G22]|nr:ThiF family adenylyltransferase [Oscillospiraceae bacterium OttesenSCG-928-G22]
MRLVKKTQVLLPEDFLRTRPTGDLFGRYFEESGIFNVVPKEFARENPALYPKIGELFLENVAPPADFTGLFGYHTADGVRFSYRGEDYETKYYSLFNDVFSRNTGILESRLLLDKRAMILGCGSVGSLVALELARSGVGAFTLIDNDVLEYHNLARHQCSISDVGDLKVNAVKRRILEINPSARVDVYPLVIETLPKEAFDVFERESGIIIGCADNRPADVYANAMSVIYKTPFLSIGCWERAFAGAIFYWLPGMPCYKCALGDGGALDARSDVSRRFYTDDESGAPLAFEPGIAADIDFVTLVGVKLSLDLLLKDTEGYTVRLLDYFRQYTLICNTHKTEVGGDMAEIFSHPLQVTTSLVTKFQGDCPPCKYDR